MNTELLSIELFRVVRATIESYKMLRPGDAVGIAVSGGADSVCLLHVLVELMTAFDLRLHVLHLNHGWRGEESDADADYVAELAAGLGLPCAVGRSSLDTAGNLEQAGRNARLAFFQQVRAAEGLDRIATGHTRSDQAETVLYRLLRGSGTAGISGMRPVTADGRIRPLLRCSRQQVEAWMLDRGLEWREDRGNADLRFDRNRIRHRLLPLLSADYQPAVAEILAATAELAQDEETYWAAEVDRLLPSLVEKKNLTSVVIRADKLSRMQAAPARRALRRLFENVRGDLRGLDLTHVERVRELARQREGHGRTQIPGLDVFRSFEWLRIGLPEKASRFDLDYAFPIGRQEAENGWTRAVTRAGIVIHLEIQPQHDQELFPPYNEEEAADMDIACFSDPLELRNWHPGDELELSGRARVKIKQLFQEFRIPIWERHLWPVLTSGKTIIWSRQFGPSATHRRTTRTRSLLRITVLESGQANSPDHR